MARRRLDQLEIGMVLDADLKDDQGRLLLPKGATLSLQHLRMMRQWRVKVVQVEGGENPVTRWRSVSLAGLDPEVHIRNEKRLADLFAFNDRSADFNSAWFYFLLDRLDRLSQAVENPQ